MGEAPIPTDDGLRERIIAHLRSRPDSISGVARALSQGRERPLHRLTVAGYLQALADVGILKPIDDPPARLYRLQEPDAHKSLHQRLWRSARALAPTDAPELAPALVVAALQALLGRPVFTAEIRHATGSAPPESLPRTTVPDEVRRQAKRALARGAQRIVPPSRDALVTLDPVTAARVGPIVPDVIARTLLDATHTLHLGAARQEPGQASLQDMAAPSVRPDPAGPAEGGASEASP